MKPNVIEVEVAEGVEVEKVVGLCLVKPAGVPLEVARCHWEDSIKRHMVGLGLTDEQSKGEPFLTIKMPCGEGGIFDTFENIPNESIPCPCGDPKHWLVNIQELKEEAVKCKCQYYLRDENGVLVCSVCGKPASKKSKIEDKIDHGHEIKESPLYVSDKDKTVAKVGQIWPPESRRI